MCVYLVKQARCFLKRWEGKKAKTKAARKKTLKGKKLFERKRNDNVASGWKTAAPISLSLRLAHIVVAARVGSSSSGNSTQHNEYKEEEHRRTKIQIKNK